MSAAFRSVAFRPLVTAGAAGVMLCGLFFVPSAHGPLSGGETSHKDGRPGVSAGPSGVRGSGRTGPADDAAGAPAGAVGSAGVTDSTGVSRTAPGVDPDRGGAFAGQSTHASRQLALGEPASIDATPWVVGGAGALCVGAAFATRSMRRDDREA